MNRTIHGISVEDVLTLAMCIMEYTDQEIWAGNQYQCRWCETEKFIKKWKTWKHKSWCPALIAISLLQKACEVRPKSDIVKKIIRMKKSDIQADRYEFREIHLPNGEYEYKKGGPLTVRVVL